MENKDFLVKENKLLRELLKLKTEEVELLRAELDDIKKDMQDVLRRYQESCSSLTHADKLDISDTHKKYWDIVGVEPIDTAKATGSLTSKVETVLLNSDGQPDISKYSTPCDGDRNKTTLVNVSNGVIGDIIPDIKSIEEGITKYNSVSEDYSKAIIDSLTGDEERVDTVRATIQHVNTQNKNNTIYAEGAINPSANSGIEIDGSCGVTCKNAEVGHLPRFIDNMSFESNTRGCKINSIGDDIAIGVSGHASIGFTSNTVVGKETPS